MTSPTLARRSGFLQLRLQKTEARLCSLGLGLRQRPGAPNSPLLRSGFSQVLSGSSFPPTLHRTARAHTAGSPARASVEGAHHQISPRVLSCKLATQSLNLDLLPDGGLGFSSNQDPKRLLLEDTPASTPTLPHPSKADQYPPVLPSKGVGTKVQVRAWIEADAFGPKDLVP